MDIQRYRRTESTSPVTVNLVERGKPVSLLSQEREESCKADQGRCGYGGGKKRTPSWNGTETGCNITRRASGQTSLRCLGTRTTEESVQKVLHMSVALFHWCSLPRQGIDQRSVSCSQHVLLVLTGPSQQCGARVFGTVSTEEKAALAREAGAEATILYTRQDFEAEVKRLTDGKGVQVVYDSVGKTTFDKSLNCLAPLGYLVLYGQASGPVPPFDAAVLSGKGSLFLARPTLGHYTADRASLEKRAGDVLGWIAAGKLKLRMEYTFALSEAAKAHASLEGRQTTGKVLLVP